MNRDVFIWLRCPFEGAGKSWLFGGVLRSLSKNKFPGQGWGDVLGQSPRMPLAKGRLEKGNWPGESVPGPSLCRNLDHRRGEEESSLGRDKWGSWGAMA